MNWIDRALAWIRSLGGGHDRLESLAVAVAGFVVAIVGALLVSRVVVPLFFRFAREESDGPMGRKVRRSVLLLLMLLPFAVYLVDRGASEEVYARPVVAAVVLLVVYLATELVLLLVVGVLARAGMRIPVLFRDIVRIGAYVTAFVAVLQTVFKVGDLSALLGASAIFSIIVGLAVQDSLGNVVAGLFMQVDRPLKVGDWVLVNGVEGRVADMNWRSTRLVTRQNDSVIIPNNTVSKADIVNYSAPTTLHRVQKRIGVSYSAQPNKVKKVLVEMLLDVKGVLGSPAPAVHLRNYGDSSIEYELRYWIEEYERANEIDDAVWTGIWYQFRRHGIEIPFPIRTVHVKREPRGEGTEPEVLALLSKVDFLAPLAEGELRSLAGDLRHHIYARGEHVFEQGDEGHTFFILWKGHVSVRVRNEGSEDVEVARLERGNYFGEISLLTGEPRNATVVAQDDCDLLELDRESFSDLLTTNAQVAETMSRIIAVRMAARKAKVDEAERTSTRVMRAQAEEISTMTKRFLTGIRGMFGLSQNP